MGECVDGYSRNSEIGFGDFICGAFQLNFSWGSKKHSRLLLMQLLRNRLGCRFNQLIGIYIYLEEDLLSYCKVSPCGTCNMCPPFDF